MFGLSRLLAHPDFYYYCRHLATGGLPFRRWVSLYRLDRTDERIADIGCGPADMLRYVGGQAKPAYYLGIDLSDKYLEQARVQARRLAIPAEFLIVDLESLPTSESVQRNLSHLLANHNISTVLLLGVLHHINDTAVLTILDLVFAVPNVRRVITQDILYIAGNRLNNAFASRDRGQFVRTEHGYDLLVASSKWRSGKKAWTTPGIRAIQYLHYELERTNGAVSRQAS